MAVERLHGRIDVEYPRLGEMEASMRSTTTSEAITLLMPCRWTLITTSAPDLNVARWIWPMLAEAKGSGRMIRNGKSGPV